jgi:VanZ family protein
MTLTRRKKLTLALLLLYWPTAFVLSHVPMPQVVRDAQMSDKSLHFLAYVMLTFLLWTVIRPYAKVNWRKAAPWCVLAIVMVYGVCDEYLQHFVAGRSADARDLVADFVGAVMALGVLTFLSFWPAFLLVAGTVIYTLAVFTRANITKVFPVTGSVFYTAAYAVFTLIWAGCLSRWPPVRAAQRRWFLASVSLPMGLIAVTKVSAVLSGKAFEGWDMIAAAGGVVASVAVVRGVEMLSRRPAKKPEFSAVDG